MFSNVCNYLRGSWSADLTSDNPSITANAKTILFNNILNCNQAPSENDIIGRLSGLSRHIEKAEKEIAEMRAESEKKQAEIDVRFAQIVERHKREQAMKKS